MKSFGKLVAVWLTLLLCPGALSAAEPLPDVRILIDVSGSMRSSDPQNLRASALELMVQLLPDGSMAGVWTFGQWVNMVVPHGEVNDAWREQASAAVAQISNFGLLTNIPDAIELSTFDIERLQHQYRTSIILLTDGKLEITSDPADNARATRSLLQKVAPDLHNWGIAVYTIALSDEADWDLLQSLAQRTGGLAERANSPEQLSRVFLQALDIAAPTEQLPVQGGEFLIDDSIEEITVLVFPEESVEGVSLVDPDGNTLQLDSAMVGLSWYHNERFELITIGNPQPGQWRIVAPGAIARVNVISHLSLALDRLPVSMPSGHSPEFGLRLVDGDRVITDPDLLAVLQLGVRVYRADDQQWELAFSGAELGASGEFRIGLPMLAEPGRYEVVLHLEGHSFQREATFVTEVSAPTTQRDASAAMPANAPSTGMPGWLLPAVVSGLLLLALLLWWFRRPQAQPRRETGSDDDDDEELVEIKR